MSTASESLDDDYSESESESEDSDEMSIKASTKMSVPFQAGGPSITTAESTSPSSYYTLLPLSYESKEVSAVPVEEPKPEVREMSTQTDEWIPFAPAMPSLFRIESGSLQQ
jgi:hypothetical protein